MRLLKISALMVACLSGALAFSPAQAQDDEDMGPQARIEHMCAEQGKGGMMAEHMAKRAEFMAEHLHLTDAQKAAFKDLQDARVKAHADAVTAMCAGKPDLSTIEKRIDFREAMLQRRLDGLKAEAPKLIAFYNSLDDKQKAKFDDMRAMWMEHHGESHHHHHHHYDEQN
jgi:hypothetical protein